MNEQNVNQNQNVGTEQVQQQVATPVQAEPQTVQTEATVQQVEQKGFGNWLKKHKKGVIAAVTGFTATVGSAFVAYKKGKAAGIMSVPAPQGQPEEDYSLNPNE